MNYTENLMAIYRSGEGLIEKEMAWKIPLKLILCLYKV